MSIAEAVAKGARVVLVVGDAVPLVDAAVQEAVDAALPSCGLPAFNHATYRAGEGTASKALAAARTLPMMASMRLVVLRDIEAADASLLAALVDYAKDPSPDTLLVITGTGFSRAQKGKPDYGARVRNAVKKNGVYLKRSNQDADPVRFAMEHAGSQGKELGRAEARLVVDLVGGDLSMVRQEVDKIALYAGDAARITREHVGAACSLLAEAEIWDLTAGLAARDADVALAALYRLLESGEVPHRLIAMVVWQYRTMLQAAEMITRGARDDDVRRKLRIRYDTFKRLKAVVKRGMPSAATVLERLARANRDMNRRRVGERRVLEALVLELCVG